MNAVVKISYEQNLRDHYAAVRARIAGAGNAHRTVELITAESMRVAREAREKAAKEARERDLLNWLKTAYREVAIPQTKRMNAVRIKREVAEKHGLTLAQIDGNSRFKNIVIARQEAFHRIHSQVGMSLPEIGKLFGGKDHTTVLYGIRRHQERMKGRT